LLRSTCVSRLSGQLPVTLDTYGHILEEGHRLDREATLQRFEDTFRGATWVLPKTGAGRPDEGRKP
jgi:hypothetical protein